MPQNTIFAAPDGGANAKNLQYFSNFFRGDKEYSVGVIECCYTTTRLSTGTIEDNAEMCALDLTPAAKSNHMQDMPTPFTTLEFLIRVTALALPMKREALLKLSSTTLCSMWQ